MSIYGLRAQSGQFFKKPTGFISNNPRTIAQLGLRCDGGHHHELVIGHDQGGLRSQQSQQAQHYPPALVEAILKGLVTGKTYRHSMGRG